MTDTKVRVPYVDLKAQGEEELEDLTEIFRSVVRGGTFVGGSPVVDLEEALADYIGVKQVVALNSGTDAIIMALLLAGVSRGHEVITTPNSFIATAAAVTHLGAKPVFVDVLPDQNMDPELIEPAVTERTKAILPVHLTGRMSRMDEICAIASKHGLAVVEDAAQSIGSKYKDVMSGAYGDYGCFSAHPLKNLNALGDGGYLATDDEAGADRVRRLRNHGMSSRTKVEEWGLVSRMDTLHAAILMYRLPKLPGIIEARRANASRYRALLEAIPEVFVPDELPLSFDTYHTFVVQVPHRDALKAFLLEAGIKTNIHYPQPIHLQPPAQKLGYKAGDFPATEEQAGRILTLPINQFVSDDDIQYVVAKIDEFYVGKR